MRLANVSEHTPEMVSKLATAGGAAASTVAGTVRVFGLSEGEWTILGIFCGIVIGAVGLIAQLWFQWRRDQREEHPDRQ